MKERVDESSIWQRKLKTNRPAKAMSLPSYSMKKKNMQRGRKLAFSFDWNSVYFQLLALGLLIVAYELFTHSQAESSIVTPIELACKNSSLWTSDILWKTSVKSPRLCPPKRGDPVVDLQQKGLDAQQLQETIDFRTPCGAYCAFHADAAASTNAVVTGWALIDRSGKGSNGCWEPFLDVRPHFCSKWFDDWKAWIVDFNKKAPLLPGLSAEQVEEAKRRADADAKRLAEAEAEAKRLAEAEAEAKRRAEAEAEAKRRAEALASIPAVFDSRCNNNTIWIKDSYWRNSVSDPAVCVADVPGREESLKLGVSYLVDSLATLTQCGSHCVFHQESSPFHAVPGQKLKGWSLGEHGSNETKGCFTPIPDVRFSHCNQWYEHWVDWVKQLKEA